MHIIVHLLVIFALMTSSTIQAQNTCKGCMYKGTCLKNGETHRSKSECVTRVCVVEQKGIYTMYSVMIQSQGCQLLGKCYSDKQLTDMDSQCVTRRCNVDNVNHSAGMTIAARGCPYNGKCYNPGDIVPMINQGNKFECKCYVDAPFVAKIQDCKYIGKV